MTPQTFERNMERRGFFCSADCASGDQVHFRSLAGLQRLSLNPVFNRTLLGGKLALMDTCSPDNAHTI